MTPKGLTAATEPTFYFIGVTTGQSSIMRVFPAWAKHLGISPCIKGIDCKWHDDPEVYRDVVRFIKDDELSLGGLVTTHKLDLLKAAKDLFDELGPYARQLEETSCISKRGGRLRAHAKDPITAGLAYEAITPGEYWQNGAELCLLGAGGSSLALTVYLMKQPEDRRPSKIHVTNRSAKRIEEMKAVHARIGFQIPIEYYGQSTAEKNDEVVGGLKPGSMVINATGLGKDAPGSPISDAAEFPQNGVAWDFNYRGDLVFLDQANAQKEARNLTVEDGWVYFIHGWTRVIAEVFDIDIPTGGSQFDTLCDIAASARR
jgi:shikimate 5-dehydrogenase